MPDDRFFCRQHCGACCIAPSITQAYWGMPNGKKAGERCVHLTSDFACRIWGSSHYPPVCRQFKADSAFCGESQLQALAILTELEASTAPSAEGALDAQAHPGSAEVN